MAKLAYIQGTRPRQSWRDNMEDLRESMKNKWRQKSLEQRWNETDGICHSDPWGVGKLRRQREGTNLICKWRRLWHERREGGEGVENYVKYVTGSKLTAALISGLSQQYSPRLYNTSWHSINLNSMIQWCTYTTWACQHACFFGSNRKLQVDQCDNRMYMFQENHGIW